MATAQSNSGIVTTGLTVNPNGTATTEDAVASTPVLFSDDFSTDQQVDPTNWSYVQYQPVDNPAYFGQTAVNQGLPVIAEGGVDLTINTYDPIAPGTGNSFLGTDIYTSQSFQPGPTGVVFQVTASLGQTQAGLVGDIFPYLLLAQPTTDRNEIDTELDSSDPTSLSVNTYADQPLGAGNPQTVPLPDGDTLTQPSTYKLVWLPNQILWYVNGTEIAQTTRNVPTGAMPLYLDFWVPGSSLGYPDLEPAATAATNNTFNFVVSSVLVTQLQSSTNGFFIDAGGTVDYSDSGRPTIVLAPQLVINDPESATLTGATVTIQSGDDTEGDMMTLGVPVAGITASFAIDESRYHMYSAVLTLAGSASVAAYQAALSDVTYTNVDRNDVMLQDFLAGRTVDWAVTDGTTTASAVSSLSVSDDDLFLQSTGGQLAFWQETVGYPTGGGLLGPDPGSSWTAMTTGAFFQGDFDDIAWQNIDGAVAIWQFTNDSTLLNGGTVALDPGPAWHIRGSADFFNDGNTDLLWQNDDGQIAIWNLEGTTVVQGGVLAADPGPQWLVRGIGDFYGDGNNDLLLQNDDGRVAIWDMEGTTIVQGGTVALDPGEAWRAVGTGDFWGDGHTDILWQNANGYPYDGGEIAMWDMEGTTVEQGGPDPYSPGYNWHVTGTGNYAGNGITSIVLQDETGDVAVWNMNGQSASSVGTQAPGADWNVLGTDAMRFIVSGSAGETLAAIPTMPYGFDFTEPAPGMQTITGFNPVQDIIEVAGGNFPDFAAIQAVITSEPGGTLIDMGPIVGYQSSVLLAGVAPDALHASNFAIT